jgi:hypothetical protein
MTQQEYKTEHRYTYDERLGLLSYTAADNPSAEHHNLAVSESDAHVQSLKIEESKDAISPLLKLRDSL